MVTLRICSVCGLEKKTVSARAVFVCSIFCRDRGGVRRAKAPDNRTLRGPVYFRRLARLRRLKLARGADADVWNA
jgi:hypothetical protein